MEMVKILIKGSFVVPPLIEPVPVTDPVFDKVKPTFFNRKSTFCSVVADHLIYSPDIMYLTMKYH